MDYESGRFLVFDEVGEQIGRVDCDEFIRDTSSQLIYRIDGDEIYDMSGNLLGILNAGRLVVNGSLFFKLVRE